MRAEKRNDRTQTCQQKCFSSFTISTIERHFTPTILHPSACPPANPVASAFIYFIMQVASTPGINKHTRLYGERTGRAHRCLDGARKATDGCYVRHRWCVCVLKMGLLESRSPTRLSFCRRPDNHEQRLDVLYPCIVLSPFSSEFPLLYRISFFFFFSFYTPAPPTTRPESGDQEAAGAASYKILLRSVYSGVGIFEWN